MILYLSLQLQHMHDNGGTELSLPVPADPCEDNISLLLQHMCDSGGAEHPLPVPADPCDGSLGEKGLHTHSTKTSSDEQATSVPPVSTYSVPCLLGCNILKSWG